ncbi:MAG TPA: histidinol-phosphate transaminase [Candidatus Xenobia bacterium]|nr:histidinol-phosphate transaminase [Candidatus Xenobia bacterium]
MPTKKPYPGLVPPNIADIRPYVPGKPTEEVERELGVTAIKLASNENALGPSPKAMEAMRQCLAGTNRYPDAGGYYLREKLAAVHNVEMDQIVLGAGSTELILLLGQIYLGPGRNGLTSQGTFVVFPMSARLAGGETLTVPLKNYAYDLEALAARLDDTVRVVYLANPNNPTGTMFTAAETDRFLARVPEDVLVILDEAYCDYVERADYSHSLDYVREGRYLMVLRTFSKVHGLAGLRIGYGIGHPEVVDAVNKMRSPFNVSALAQAAALAALDDTEHVRRSVEMNRRGMAFLQRELAGLSLKVVPSFANFLYVETGRNAQDDFKDLLQMGVIVRPLGFMGMPQGLRVTVGTESENQRVVEAFARLMAVVRR